MPSVGDKLRCTVPIIGDLNPKPTAVEALERCAREHGLTVTKVQLVSSKPWDEEIDRWPRPVRGLHYPHLRSDCRKGDLMECPQCGLDVLVQDGAVVPHLRPDTLNSCDGKPSKPAARDTDEPKTDSHHKAPTKAAASKSSKESD